MSPLDLELSAVESRFAAHSALYLGLELGGPVHRDVHNWLAWLQHWRSVYRRRRRPTPVLLLRRSFIGL